MKKQGQYSKKNMGKYLEVRLGPSEKEAFRIAADLDGLSLSAWVRSRLRKAAREELQNSGREVPFLSGGD